MRIRALYHGALSLSLSLHSSHTLRRPLYIPTRLHTHACRRLVAASFFLFFSSVECCHFIYGVAEQGRSPMREQPSSTARPSAEAASLSSIIFFFFPFKGEGGQVEYRGRGRECQHEDVREVLHQRHLRDSRAAGVDIRLALTACRHGFNYLYHLRGIRRRRRDRLPRFLFLLCLSPLPLAPLFASLQVPS